MDNTKKKRTIECTLPGNACHKFRINVTCRTSTPQINLIFKIEEPCSYVNVGTYGVTECLRYIMDRLWDYRIGKAKSLRIWGEDRDGNNGWFSVEFLEDAVKIDTDTYIYVIKTDPISYASDIMLQITYFFEDVMRRKQSIYLRPFPF